MPAVLTLRSPLFAICSWIAVATGGTFAQATHPTVQFAAGLLKQGQIDEALTALKARVDADPADCKAMGLVVLAYVQQRDIRRGQPWVERLQGLPACAPTSGVVSKLLSDAAKKEELVKTIAQFVSTGDLGRIEKTIAAAENTIGVLASVRAYVDALKGEFPAVDDAAKQAALPKALVDALRQRKADVATANYNSYGAYLAPGQACLRLGV